MVRYELDTLQQVRYDLNTGTRHFGNSETTSLTRVPDNSVSSVRPQYRYLTLGLGRHAHKKNAGTGLYHAEHTVGIEDQERGRAAAALV